MRQKIVGSYGMGWDQCQIVLREGDGGEFWLIPEMGSIPRIKVGADDSWENIVGVLCHELLELIFVMQRVRFERTNITGMGHDGYVFMFDHNQFSDAVMRLGNLVSICLPDVHKVWKNFNKKK